MNQIKDKFQETSQSEDEDQNYNNYQRPFIRREYYRDPRVIRIPIQRITYDEYYRQYPAQMGRIIQPKITQILNYYHPAPNIDSQVSQQSKGKSDSRSSTPDIYKQRENELKLDPMKLQVDNRKIKINKNKINDQSDQSMPGDQKFFAERKRYETFKVNYNPYKLKKPIKIEEQKETKPIYKKAVRKIVQKIETKPPLKSKYDDRSSSDCICACYSDCSC